MKAVRPLPKEVEKVLGEKGSEDFSTFLTESFEDQKVDVVQSVHDSFQKHVSDEVSKVRLELAGLRIDMSDLRGELKAELKSDIAGLETKIAYLHSEMKSDSAEIHRAIAIQTRWILVALLGGAVLYPIAIKLFDQLLP